MHHQLRHGRMPTTALKCASIVTAAFGATANFGSRGRPAGACRLRVRPTSARRCPRGDAAGDKVAARQRPRRAAEDRRRPRWRLVVTYASRDPKYNGHAFIARSNDGGKTFSPPHRSRPTRPASVSRRPRRSGRPRLRGLDRQAQRRCREPRTNPTPERRSRSLGRKPGGTLDPATIARDNACECCRIAVAFAGPGKPVVLFRKFSTAVSATTPSSPSTGQRRDRSSASATTTPSRRLPASRPSIAIGPDGAITYLVRARPQAEGALLRALRGRRKHLSQPMPLGNPNAQTSRPYVLAGGDGSISPTRHSTDDDDRRFMTSRDQVKPGPRRAPSR